MRTGEMISTPATEYEQARVGAGIGGGQGSNSTGTIKNGDLNAKPLHPCDACKRSKLKCDQRRPACETCQKRRKPCNYSAADEYTDGRIRKFHRRSRNGCSHCKARRVRCDEVKPVCGGCRRKDAAELCIFPPNHGRSSRSGSPNRRSTSPAPIPTSQSSFPVAVNVSAAESSQVNGTSGPMNDYFAQPPQIHQTEPLVGQPTIDLSLPDANANPDPVMSNAVSIWNPTFNTPSPNTLLASLFGPLPVDPYSTGLTFDSHPFKSQSYDPTFDLNLTADISKLDDSSGDIDDRRFFDILSRMNSNDDNGMTTRQDHMIGPEAFSLESLDSTGSTPISLNGNTAYNSNLASFVRPEYRNRPEHPAYLYQLQMLENPEQLAPYFPSLEQRHQYRHFFQETSKSLLVTPTSQSTNPFLCHFSHLALGAPAGQSLCHDAFRSALLSLASLDIGIKMSMAMPGMSQNAMYATSDEQRSEAHKRLIAASISGMFVEDSADAELAIATTVALSIRDRLAGCQEWEPPLKIGRDVVVDAGGPAAFINARPTSDRRFLVEQMAVLELIGYLTIWVSPKLFEWDNEWFQYHDAEEGPDHLEIVYGWTREAIIYAARAMRLCGEARDIEAMRDAQPKPGYRRLKEIIDARANSLIRRVREFLPQGEIVKANTMMTLSPPEVTVGVLGVQACMDLCLRTVILMEDIKAPQVQNLVKTILDISDDSISRGRYAGLLLPLSWADGVAYDPILKKRAKISLSSLRQHYHLNPELLDRIINIDWATLNNIGLGDWEAFLRKHGYYVPCF